MRRSSPNSARDSRVENRLVTHRVLHEPYRVIYEVLEDRIEILTLTHFRQELPSQPPGGSF